MGPGEAGRELAPDSSVFARGARHSYFGHTEWERFAPGLKSVEDALDIRRRILIAFERAEREPDPAKRHQYLTFVVIGGGDTGVGMAGAIAAIRRFALSRDLRHIDPREATVMLVEGGPRLLPSYPPALSARAKADLRALGVEVRENTLVTGITAASVEAAGWVIPTTTVVWAAGNQASPLLKTLGGPLDSQGRALVEPDCTVPGHPELFVLGDAAAFLHQAGQSGPLPGVCPVAIQMGQYAAAAIKHDLAGKARIPFSYWDKGQLAVISRGHAVADLVNLTFAGVAAWMVCAFVHTYCPVSFPSRCLERFEDQWRIACLLPLGQQLAVRSVQYPFADQVGNQSTGSDISQDCLSLGVPVL